MPDSTIWSLPSRTSAKHTLLREYLKAWYPIMGRTEKRVGYIDGFAGPGRYKDGEPGSPIVALTTLLDHAAFASFEGDFVFKFIEADTKRAANLQHELETLATDRGGLPTNVRWSVESTTFATSTKSFLDGLEARHRLIPALVLIDPFGFKGVPLAQIADLLQWSKCEVIFNFMFDAVNRWATADVNPKVLAHYDDLFGSQEYRNAPQGAARKEFLRALYEEQLHDVAKFTYVRWFEMVTAKGRTGNYLFFGTRNETGLSRMKAAMWKVDPEYGTRFIAPKTHAAQMTLDLPIEADLSPLRAQIIDQFKGTIATIEQVERFVLTNTDYLEKSHLKVKTLKPMQAAGLIANVEGQGRPGQFPPRCKIRFA